MEVVGQRGFTIVIFNSDAHLEKTKHDCLQDLEHVSSAHLLDLDETEFTDEEADGETMPTKIAFDRHNDEHDPDPDDIYTDGEDEQNERSDEEDDDNDSEDET